MEVSGAETAGLDRSRMEFAAGREVHVPVKTGSRLVGGDIRLQARGGFQPVVEVMAGLAAALLIKMKGIIADVVFFGFKQGGGKRRVVFHEICILEENDCVF